MILKNKNPRFPHKKAEGNHGGVLRLEPKDVALPAYQAEIYHLPAQRWRSIIRVFSES